MEEKKTKFSKRGERFERNPFVENAICNSKNGVKKVANKEGDKLMVVNSGTGEVLSPAGFWQIQEVDRTQFVKLYVNGVRAFRDLTSAGTKVFEILYMRVQEEIGRDKIWLTFPGVDQKVTPIGETTFYRGVKELLQKQFIAESLAPGIFFLNPDYMWNGDRLTFVKQYRKKVDIEEAKEALGISTLPKIFKDF